MNGATTRVYDKGNFMDKDIDKEFYLTRGQYAEKLNKSKGAVIQAMRRGQLQTEYIVKNNQYYFKDPETKRDIKGQYIDTKYTPKKIYRRGNHFKAKYPNVHFQRHNELKMLAKLKGTTDTEILDLLPDALEKARQEKFKQKQKQLIPETTKNYGGWITGSELNRLKFKPNNKGKNPKKKTYY